MEKAKGARKSVLGAIAVAAIWLVAMVSFSFVAPLSGGFRVHMLFGLGVFSAIILAPLLLVLGTLNWALRRLAGFLILFLFFGMVRGGLSQGFAPLADVGIVLVTGTLVGSMLFFISRPSVMAATSDYYSFLRPKDLFSSWTFHRKRTDA